MKSVQLAHVFWVCDPELHLSTSPTLTMGLLRPGRANILHHNAICREQTLRCALGLFRARKLRTPASHL